jgi:hypothetical protein
MMRTSVIRHFDVTLPFASPKSSGWHALMFPGWLAAMRGQSAPVQGQAEPPWQDGSDVGSYFHSSTVFGRHQEGKRISLVTMADAFCTMV